MKCMATVTAIQPVPESLAIHSFVWTDHARERARRRRIPEAAIRAVLNRPAKVYPGKQAGTYKLIGTYQQRRLHLILAPNERKQWVLVSLWVRGEDDRRFWLENWIDQGVNWVLHHVWPFRLIQRG
jgi:hypothetical protein